MTTLKQEREQLYIDLWNAKRPKRMPVEFPASLDFAIDYFGYNPKVDMYNPQLTYELADKTAEMIGGDVLPLPPVSPAAIYRYAKQATMEQGKDGFFQHPNIAFMELEEYPEFIENPFQFIVEKIHPRIFGILKDEPIYGQLKLNIARSVVTSKYAGFVPKLAEKYQRSTIAVSPLMLWAPFDFIADYIRSFSTMLIDLRRKPQWVLDACEAVADYEIEQVKKLPKPDSSKITFIRMPLHMAPYMKPKDFEKYYWPTFQRVVEGFQKEGFQVQAFAEEDWTPHLEAMNDLPGTCRLGFEKPDPKDVAEKIDKRHIITNLYPIHILRTGTKQQCIDEAKKLIDITGPKGNAIFSTQKVPLRKNDYNIENVQAVIEFVEEYGKY
jgi:hypothetical protein